MAPIVPGKPPTLPDKNPDTPEPKGENVHLPAHAKPKPKDKP